jgi:hypothetical protein
VEKYKYLGTIATNEHRIANITFDTCLSQFIFWIFYLYLLSLDLFNDGFYKRRGISWLAKWLLGSQGLSSMKLVIWKIISRLFINDENIRICVTHERFSPPPPPPHTHTHSTRWALYRPGPCSGQPDANQRTVSYMWVVTSHNGTSVRFLPQAAVA